MDINFELYKIFYTVAKTGSFTSAAKELFVSQSAVSQSIKNLEDNTGSRLFIRDSRNVRLTAVGKMLYSHVEQAYNIIKAAENKVLEMQSLNAGEIGIGVGDTILRYIITPYLQQFIKQYQNVKIQITNRTSPGIIESIKKGSVDFGIVTLPVNEKDIDTIKFREVEDVFVASPPLFSSLIEKNVSVNELSSLPLLLLQKGSSTRLNLDNYFTSKGLKIIPEIELESMDLLVEYARIGLGIAYVLKESSDALITKGELFTLSLEEAIPKRVLGIAKLKNVPLSPAASKFVAKLKEARFS